jgi:hypothetical protein
MSSAIFSPPTSATRRPDRTAVPVTRRAPRWSDRTIGASARELALMVAVFMVYRQVRHLTSGDLDLAMDNADRVVAAERWFGLFSEGSLQRLVLRSQFAIDVLDHYYVLVHFTASVGFMAWVFLRHPQAWGRIRAWFLSVTIAGLAIHVAFPLAPPRMLGQHGFVDTLHVYGPNIYSRDVTESAANQLAAMPSLHFAWAAIVAAGFITIRRSRWSLLVVLHPLVTLLAIVATANHYWLDAIVGGALVAAAIVATHLGIRSITRFRPAPVGWLVQPQFDVVHQARRHRARCAHQGRSTVQVADHLHHVHRQIRAESATR